MIFRWPTANSLNRCDSEVEQVIEKWHKSEAGFGCIRLIRYNLEEIEYKNFHIKTEVKGDTRS